MNEGIQAYPLQWPAGWKRTPSHQRTAAKFHTGDGKSLSVGHGADRIYRELRAFGIPERHVIISSDLRLRLDGKLYSNQPIGLTDPGVAVYWQDGKQQRCMAIDRYTRVPDNLAAVAATIMAMRTVERHGGAVILDRAFQGFAALPSPTSWWQLLRLRGPDVSADEIRAAHRRLISEHHPDNGGETNIAALINRARDQGLEAIR